MHQHSLEVLELDKIINTLTGFAATEVGKEIISRLRPVADNNYIRERLAEVTAGCEIKENYGKPPFGGIRDLRDIIKKVNKDMVLSAEEIVSVQNSLNGIRNLEKFFQEIIAEEDPVIIEKRYSLLTDKALQLELLTALERNLDRCFDEYGEIKDNASGRLASIRKKIESTENQIREKLNNIIRGTKYQSMLQDSLITKRENRYVVPIKKEFRNTFNGIVHDHSASGMTIFMEPMVIVRLNNRMREMKGEEDAEIFRILQELTAKIKLKLEVIKSNLKIASILDVVFARVDYSGEIKGTAPEINNKRTIRIKEGRHPLLQDEAVPIDAEVGKDFTSLVITGPNTGGKTVALKTVGLFVLMTELGLHLPASRGTSISLFAEVFADIGDEQSIEQDLSTFSSHMNNIKSYLKKADEDSLVLLDELGAGTDPKEGAALGIAILEKLKENNAIAIATTHYGQLKSYAYSTPGVENASVEFDLETLRPTYRLIMGVPGGSNAFEIALRLGLPEQIIENAKNLINEQDLNVENIISDLNHQRQKYQELKQESRARNRRAKKLEEKYDQQLQELEEQKNKIIKEAHEEAEAIIKDARKQTKKIIRNLKNRDFQVRPEVDRKAAKINNQLKEIEDKFTIESEKSSQEAKEPLQIGDQVRIMSVGQKGKVVDIDEENEEATVQAGIMKVTAALNELSKVELAEQENEEMIKKYRVNKSKSVSNRLDLRGERYDEAQYKLNKYLDDAFLAGYNELEIVHGKGTGALREAVQEILEEHQHVSSYRLGRPEEGGTGVSIVSIKN